jgi:hypothetical protein
MQNSIKSKKLSEKKNLNSGWRTLQNFLTKKMQNIYVGGTRTGSQA